MALIGASHTGDSFPPNPSDVLTSTPRVFMVADFRASPNVTSDVMFTDIEVSLASPTAVAEVVVGRLEISDTGSYGGHYFRGSPSAGNLPGLVETTAPFGFHHVIGTYFISGGHPLQLHYGDDALEAFYNAETNTDQAVAIWLRRVDSDDGIGFHVNARYEVNL